ncbi:MAG: copper resistance protein B [Acidimicrobiia bacterium]
MTGQQVNRPTGPQGWLLAFVLVIAAPFSVAAQVVDHGGHAVHDRAINFQVLFDQLEWQVVHGEQGQRWDSRSWIGGDVNRIWFRTEGDSVDGEIEAAEAQLLYGRSINRFWDVVAGVRFDARPTPSHTWLAVGVQGLAPQFIDVLATLYIGQNAHLGARLEFEHDLHVTQRIVLQPLVELSLSGSEDADRGIGKGLSTAEVGFRLRYEIRRELAPYAGVVWHRKLFGTGDFTRDSGGDAGGWHVVTGLRFWF